MFLASNIIIQVQQFPGIILSLFLQEYAATKMAVSQKSAKPQIDATQFVDDSDAGDARDFIDEEILDPKPMT